MTVLIFCLKKYNSIDTQVKHNVDFFCLIFLLSANVSATNLLLALASFRAEHQISALEKYNSKYTKQA